MKFFINLLDKGCEGMIYILVEIVLGFIYIVLCLFRVLYVIRFKYEYNNFMINVYKF